MKGLEYRREIILLTRKIGNLNSTVVRCYKIILLLLFIYSYSIVEKASFKYDLIYLVFLYILIFLCDSLHKTNLFHNHLISDAHTLHHSTALYKLLPFLRYLG